MVINSITYGINPLNTQNNNKNHNNSVQNFKGNFVRKSSINTLPIVPLNLSSEFSKVTQKILSYIKNFDLINQLRQSGKNLQENLLIINDSQNLNEAEEFELSAKINFTEKRLEKLQENSESRLRKHCLSINGESFEFNDYSADPKFLSVINRCLNSKGSSEERAKMIMNLLLEYMGYEKDAVKLEICHNEELGYGDASYQPSLNCLQISDKILKSNVFTALSFLHELTHMDNHAKLIKKFGYRNIMYNDIEDFFKNYRGGRNNFINHIREENPNFPLEATDEEICNETYNQFQKRYYNINFYKNSDISNNKYIEMLKNYDTSYLRYTNCESLLDYALYFPAYYNSPDECLAYARCEELLSLFGLGETYSENFTTEKLISNKAMEIASQKAEEILGIKDITHLTESQYKKLNNSILEDTLYYNTMVEYLWNLYQNGETMPMPREKFERIYLNGDIYYKQYINCKMLDDNNEKLMKELKNMYKNKGGNIDRVRIEE